MGGLIILFFGVSGFTEYEKMINEYKIKSNLSTFNYLSHNHQYSMYDISEDFTSYSAEFIKRVNYFKLKNNEMLTTCIV